MCKADFTSALEKVKKVRVRRFKKDKNTEK